VVLERGKNLLAVLRRVLEAQGVVFFVKTETVHVGFVPLDEFVNLVDVIDGIIIERLPKLFDDVKHAHFVRNHGLPVT